MRFLRPTPNLLTNLVALATLAALAPNVQLPSLEQQALAVATQSVVIQFAANVGKQPFACGQTYSLGQPASLQTLTDFRFYVSELALIDPSGKVVPISLEQDGKWQYQSVALLDFENKTGACSNGTTELRDRVIGRVPPGNYTGLQFTLGVPFQLNHGDTALAPSPLNLTGLWWNWQLGYKFARIDLQRPMVPGMMAAKPGHGSAAGFPIHLGSTGCLSSGSSARPTSCNYPNRARVVLSRFDPATSRVVADLARLVAQSNLSQNQVQTAPGCMSEPTDRDCAGIMANLGLPFMSQPNSSQIFFRVE